MLKVVAAVGLPISLVGFVLGIAGHMSQIGFLFTAEPLSPDFEKINPLNGFKRLFSARNLIETARVVIKGIVLCFTAYSILRTAIERSPELIFRNPKAIFEVLGDTGRMLFLSLCGVLIVFAAVDFFLQRREFAKQVRVTRQEAKQEAKEQEGDPLIKSRIRSIQRDMARKRMMQAVKKADVIITNPTHIAIALQYDKEKMVAPKVVAKGADFMAERIKKIAAESGVVTVENVPLARALFKSVKVGQVIPRNLFQAVAEVLAYVYKLRNVKL
jgi:flagellar biosynthetic protein FlhB